MIRVNVTCLVETDDDGQAREIVMDGLETNPKMRQASILWSGPSDDNPQEEFLKHAIDP